MQVVSTDVSIFDSYFEKVVTGQFSYVLMGWHQQVIGSSCLNVLLIPLNIFEPYPCLGFQLVLGT